MFSCQPVCWEILKYDRVLLYSHDQDQLFLQIAVISEGEDS